MRKLLLSSMFAVALTHAVMAGYFSWGFYSTEIRNVDDEYCDEGTAFLYLGDVTASPSGFRFGNSVFVASCGYNEDSDNFGVFGGDGSNIPPYGYATSDRVESIEAGQKFSLILVDQANVVPGDLPSYKGHYILHNGVSAKGSYQDQDGLSMSILAEYAIFQVNSHFGASDWQYMSSAKKKVGFTIIIQ